MSIWAPADSPPIPAPPVLLLTLELATVVLSWARDLVLVTLLSCVSAGVCDTLVFECVAGGLPSLWRTLSLAGGRPFGEGEEEVGVSEGGSLNLPPRRRRVMGGAFIADSFFWREGGFLRTPAYWRTEPSPSLSSSFSPAFPALCSSAASSPLSRRLNTPVGCKNMSTMSSELIFKMQNAVNVHRQVSPCYRLLSYPPSIQLRVSQTQTCVSNLHEEKSK